MPVEPYIPQATLDKINAVHPPGTRHNAATMIALPLVGNGMPPEQVIAILQQKFAPGLTDAEIGKIVQWCVGKNPTPSGYGVKPQLPAQRWTPAPVAPVKVIPPAEKMNWWLSGLTLTADKLTQQSLVKIQPDPADSCRQFLSLYTATEHVNIVCKFTIEGDKVRPDGGGRSLTPDGWKQHIEAHGVPKSEAGAWVRMNPVKPTGSGHGGAITDADVVAHRFMLLESDRLPIETQLAFYSLAQLPVAMIVLSGGDSAHAWLRVDAATDEAYAVIVRRLLDALTPFGFDQANKNPSRLSRLPGSQRKHGGKDGGLQRLLWLNPTAAPLTMERLADFEESLTLPAVHELPMQMLVRNSIPRYEELIQNRGKLGVMTGFEKIDRISGGLKKGQTTVVAGETGAGKSTVGINIINHALQNGHGVLLFTMEMDREEIVDLLVSINGLINRNSFNTGYFNEAEEARLVDTTFAMSKLPLWIEDSPAQTLAQIQQRTKQLAKQNKIGLVVVDYIGLITPDDERAPREQQVAVMSRGLRVLAKETKLPIIILSQLNDEGKLRESRAVGHEANNVIVIEADQSTPDKITLHVVKGRKIPKGKHDIVFDYIHAKLIGTEEKITDDDMRQHREYNNQ